MIMEKKLFVLIFMLASFSYSFAQLTVNSNGSISMVTGSTTAKDIENNN